MDKQDYIYGQKRSMLIALMAACVLLVPFKVHADESVVEEAPEPVIFEELAAEDADVLAEEFGSLPVRTHTDDVLVLTNRHPVLEIYIREECAKANIAPELIFAIIERESMWDEGAENGACKGLMQIYQPSHRARMERLSVTDLMDPYENILVGIDILRELFETYEEPALVLMHYNMAPETADRLWGQGITSGYANEVLSRAFEIEQEGSYE